MLVSVLPDRFVRGWKPERSNVPHSAPLDLMAALTLQHNTDAHAVSYLAPHRLVHGHEGEGVLCNVLFADVDNPGHVAWRDDTSAAMRAQWEGLSGATFGVYTTAHGLHFVQPLEQPIALAVLEHTMAAFRDVVSAHGFDVDHTCKDWTRLYRLPRVRREGRPVVPDFEDYSRMTPVHVEPIAEAPPRARRKPSVRREALVPVEMAPTEWTARLAPVLATIVRLSDYGPGLLSHEWALAIAGALCELGVRVELIPSIVAQLASGNDAARVQNRQLCARDTVERWRQGLQCAGLSSLPMAVRDALVVACMAKPKEARPDLERMLKDAREGVTVIGAECGSGKTRAAMRVAEERARSKPAKVDREVQGVRTVISVPDHKLADQVVADLLVPARKRLGVLSHSDGCIHEADARPLVAGGQSIVSEFCEGRGKQRCDRYATCQSRLGSVGDADARVVVTPHQLLSEAAAWAGPSGLVVIDEPPPLFASVLMTPDAIALVLAELRRFEPVYRDRMRPLLESLHAWVCDGDGEALPVPVGLPTEPPPLTWGYRFQMRLQRDLGARLGAVSGTLRAIQDCVAWSREQLAEGDGFVIVVTTQDRRLAGVLQREGPTVLTDAGAAVHIPALTKVLGEEPRYVSGSAPDGAPVERTLFQWQGATRRGWLAERADAKGKAKQAADVAAALGTALRWAKGERLLVVSFRSLLERPDVVAQLAAYEGIVETWHFGSTRGKNDWTDFDCVATLGDPFQNLAAVGAEAEFLGVNSDQRGEDLAKVELEQAHGRLRLVHRQRPARAAHVGRLWPGGWGWTPERVRVVEQAMPGALRVRVTEEGLEAVAASLGITPKALRHRMAREGEM